MVLIFFGVLGSVRGDWGGKVKVKGWKSNRGIVRVCWRGSWGCSVCSM